MFSSNLENPGVTLLSFIVTSLVLLAIAWLHGGVYKRWPLNVLEALFLLNLGVFAAGSTYARYEGRNQAAVAYVSISTSLFVFIGIISYDALSQFLHLPSCTELVAEILACCGRVCTSDHEQQPVSRHATVTGRGTTNITRTQVNLEIDSVPNGQDASQRLRSLSTGLREPLDLIS